MTRTKNTSAAAELGGSLTALHEQAGSPAYRTIEYALLDMLGPDHTPTGESIRKAHKGGLDPYSADLLTTSALANYYGASLHELHPALAERFRLLRSASNPHSARAATARAARHAQSPSAAIVSTGVSYQKHLRSGYRPHRQMAVAT